MHSTLNPEQPDPIARHFEQVALEEQMARTLADDAAGIARTRCQNVAARGRTTSSYRPNVPTPANGWA